MNSYLVFAIGFGCGFALCLLLALWVFGKLADCVPTFR
jgi:hypothetical protein